MSLAMDIMWAFIETESKRVPMEGICSAKIAIGAICIMCVCIMYIFIYMASFDLDEIWLCLGPTAFLVLIISDGDFAF